MHALLFAAALVCATPDNDVCQAQATFAAFIAGQNDHNALQVQQTLWRSNDVLWARNAGVTVTGFSNVMAAFEAMWQRPWNIAPVQTELHATELSPGVVQILVPARLTIGDPAGGLYNLPIRWAGIFVKFADGWKITSIFVTQVVRRASTAAM